MSQRLYKYIKELGFFFEEMQKEIFDTLENKNLIEKGETLMVGKQANSVVPMTEYESVLEHNPGGAFVSKHKDIEKRENKKEEDGVDSRVKTIQAFDRFVGYLDSQIEENI